MSIFKEIEDNNIDVLRVLILQNKLEKQNISKILNIASINGYLKILLLIKKYFFLDFINNINLILINLVVNNHDSSVKYLLNIKVINFEKEKIKLNADFLTFCSRNGNLDLVKFITKNTNFSNNVSYKYYNDAVLQAGEKNHPNVVLYLISEGLVNFNFVANRLLMYFSRHGDLNMCQKIIQHQEKQIFTNEPFVYCCESEHINIVKYFLDLNIFNPAGLHNSSIINAYEKKNDILIKMLFKDDRVKETLRNDSIQAYNYAIKFDVEEKINNF